MTLAAQLKAFYAGKMPSGDAFYFGETPGVLEAAGLEQLPLACTILDFRKSKQEKHNVPRRVLKSLNHDLETALFAFTDGDRVGVITADIDGDGKPLLVGIERNVNMDRQRVNVINSMYWLDHPAAWLNNQIKGGKTFTLLDEKRANSFLQTYGYWASVGEGIRSLREIVSQDSGESKRQTSLQDGKV